MECRTDKAAARIKSSGMLVGSLSGLHASSRQLGPRPGRPWSRSLSCSVKWFPMPPLLPAPAKTSDAGAGAILPPGALEGLNAGLGQKAAFQI